MIDFYQIRLFAHNENHKNESTNSQHFIFLAQSINETIWRI